MGYLVTTFASSDDTGLRVEDALAALEWCVAIMRREDWPEVEDDAGGRVSLARLLLAATADAAEPAALRRRTGTLVEYLEIARYGAWLRAHEMLVAATGPDREHELLDMESRGVPVSAERRADHEELGRLRTILFAQGAWREAGRSWAWHFGVTVPEPVLEALAERQGSRFSAEELRAGVREGLDKLAEHRARRTNHAGRAAVGSPERAPGGRPGAGRARGGGR